MNNGATADFAEPDTAKSGTAELKASQPTMAICKHHCVLAASGHGETLKKSAKTAPRKRVAERSPNPSPVSVVLFLVRYRITLTSKRYPYASLLQRILEHARQWRKMARIPYLQVNLQQTTQEP